MDLVVKKEDYEEEEEEPRNITRSGDDGSVDYLCVYFRSLFFFSFTVGGPRTRVHVEDPPDDRSPST